MKDSPVIVLKWLHSSSGRSKRTEITVQGCFMLEHVATGRYYVGQSDTVSQEVDKQLSLLSIGKHRSKLLNGIYGRDQDIKVYEYPAKAKKARIALLRTLAVMADTPYLLLNPKDIP